MGTNYKDVTAGQPVALSAQWHNDINRILNTFNGFGDNMIIGGDPSGYRVNVFNNSGSVLKAGHAVMFRNRYAEYGGHSVAPYDSDLNYQWGVLSDELQPGECGMATVFGPVKVKVNGTAEGYVSPSKDGSEFKYSRTGVKVLSYYKDEAVILLGVNNPPEAAGYEGQFSVKDRSKGNDLKVLAYGGETDLGTVHAKEFEIKDYTKIYLLAEYRKSETGTGGYYTTLTDNWQKDKKSDEYALWLIADISVKTDKSNNKYLEIVQQWQSGAIYFGSRFWI